MDGPACIPEETVGLKRPEGVIQTTSTVWPAHGTAPVVWGKGQAGENNHPCATAALLADVVGLKVLLTSDPAHSTSDSLDVPLGPEPVEVEGVPGLYGLEMDPEAKLSNLLPKVGEAMNNMGGNSLGGLGGFGMMLDPSAKDELDDVKSDIKTADMILPGLDEALVFDELLTTHGKSNMGRSGV